MRFFVVSQAMEGAARNPRSARWDRPSFDRPTAWSSLRSSIEPTAREGAQDDRGRGQETPLPDRRSQHAPHRHTDRHTHRHTHGHTHCRPQHPGSSPRRSGRSVHRSWAASPRTATANASSPTCAPCPMPRPMWSPACADSGPGRALEPVGRLGRDSAARSSAPGIGNWEDLLTDPSASTDRGTSSRGGWRSPTPIARRAAVPCRRRIVQHRAGVRSH